MAAYSPNLITGASNFSTTSTPTLAQVNKWLTSGCGIINSRLQMKGYSIPTDTTLAVYDELAQLNTLYACAQAEKARTNVRLTIGERTRGQLFEKDFWDELNKFIQQDLSRAGLTYAHAGYAGATSQSDKATVAANSDRVPSRFFRREFSNRGRTGGVGGVTLSPGGEGDTETSAS